jgi:hypothetical protein
MTDCKLDSDWKSSYTQFMIPLRPGKQSNYAAYNTHYYPDHVETLLYRAEHIHSLVLFYGLNYSSQLSHDIQSFQAELNQLMKIAPRNWPDEQKHIAICEPNTSGTMLFGFVISVKALLDVMATVWVKIADSNTDTMTFNKGSVNGDTIAGGRLINWFRCTCNTKFENHAKVASTIEKHSREWITELVKYRDNFNHHGGIPNMIPLCVRLDLINIEHDKKGTFPRTEYQDHEIILPTLPTEQPVAEFISFVGSRIQQMMREMAGFFSSDEFCNEISPPGPGDRWYVSDHLRT